MTSSTGRPTLPPSRSAASWLAPAATAQLGLLLAWASAASPAVRHAPLLLGALAAVALLAAVRMGTARCMESRVAATAVGAFSATGVLLTSTVGLPGSAPRPVDLPAVALLLVAVAVVVLVALDERVGPTVDDPYAS